MSTVNVTVIVPVYNDRANLPNALQALLAQTLKEIEIIVVDDGSTDGSYEVALSVSREIRVLRLPHRGLPATLNAGISAAKGRYIAINDSDDVALPQKLEMQYAFLEAYQNIALVGTLAQTTDEETGATTLNLVPAEQAEILRVLPWQNAFVHSSVMFRKKCVEDLGLYNVTLRRMQDYDLWLRLCSAHRAANIPEVLVLRKQRVNSHTRIKKSRAFAEIAAIRIRNIRPPFRCRMLASIGFAYLRAFLSLMKEIYSESTLRAARKNHRIL